MNLFSVKTKLRILYLVKKALGITRIVTGSGYEISDTVTVKSVVTADAYMITRAGGKLAIKQQLFANMLDELEKSAILETTIRHDPVKRQIHVAGGLVVLIDKTKQLHGTKKQK